MLERLGRITLRTILSVLCSSSLDLVANGEKNTRGYVRPNQNGKFGNRPKCNNVLVKKTGSELNSNPSGETTRAFFGLTFSIAIQASNL